MNISFMRKSTIGWLVAMTCVLAFGSWLRLAQLGQPSLHVDEYYHALAADRILQGDGPKLPSGNNYTRAYPYTLSVAASYWLFGQSDASSRFPSVVFSLLMMLIVGGVVWRWFGRGAAFIAVTLVAIAPMLVDTARLSRMYSLFQFFYLCTAMAYAFTWERKHNAWPVKVLGTFWCLVLLYLGMKIHPLMQGIAPALFVFWVLMSFANWKSHHALFVVVTVSAGLAAFVLGFLDVHKLLEQVNYAPSWADSRRYLYDFYVRIWRQGFAWIWLVTPMAVAWSVWRYRVRGLFISCLFGVPFLLHSYIFDWKEGRYVSHLFPFAALILSPFLADAVTWIKQRFQNKTLQGISVVLCCLIAGALCLPAVKLSVQLQDDPTRPRWREALLNTHAQFKENSVIVATIPLAVSHYLNRQAHYTLNNFDSADFQGKMDRDDAGLWIDWYTGSKMITSLEEFQNAARGNDVWVYLDMHLYANDIAVPKDLREHLIATCSELPAVPDASVKLFHCGI